MAIISTNYRVSQGEHGLLVIEASGRATSDERAALEANVLTRYQLVPYPAAAGAVCKVLDGSQARRYRIVLPTGASVTCVKVGAEVNPMAPAQAADMPYAAKKIVRFSCRYQQIGRV